MKKTGQIIRSLDGRISTTRFYDSQYPNNGASISDTESTIIFHIPDGNIGIVSITTKLIPGLRYWERPPAHVLRKWVDEILVGTDFRRIGKVEYYGFTNGWRSVYTVGRIK